MYSPELLDHFEHPRNAGELPEADARVRVDNPVCGDILELFIKVYADRIVDLRFRAKGCVPAMACGSAVTELVRGRLVSDAKALSREDVVGAVGGLPAESGHAAQLAIEGLRQVLRRFSDRE
jgi:nitrogen fixation NifU-like protein